MLELAKETELRRAKPILEEVRAAIHGFKRFADEAGVPAKKRDAVNKVLGVSQVRR